MRRCEYQSLARKQSSSNPRLPKREGRRTRLCRGYRQNEYGLTAQCPDSKVRIVTSHTRLRTSESKGHQEIYNSTVAFWFRSPHGELAVTMIRTSGPPH